MQQWIQHFMYLGFDEQVGQMWTRRGRNPGQKQKAKSIVCVSVKNTGVTVATLRLQMSPLSDVAVLFLLVSDRWALLGPLASLQ